MIFRTLKTLPNTTNPRRWLSTERIDSGQKHISNSMPLAAAHSKTITFQMTPLWCQTATCFPICWSSTTRKERESQEIQLQQSHKTIQTAHIHLSSLIVERVKATLTRNLRLGLKTKIITTFHETYPNEPTLPWVTITIILLIKDQQYMQDLNRLTPTWSSAQLTKTGHRHNNRRKALKFLGKRTKVTQNSNDS